MNITARDLAIANVVSLMPKMSDTEIRGIVIAMTRLASGEFDQPDLTVPLRLVHPPAPKRRNRAHIGDTAPRRDAAGLACSKSRTVQRIAASQAD